MKLHTLYPTGLNISSPFCLPLLFHYTWYMSNQVKLFFLPDLYQPIIWYLIWCIGSATSLSVVSTKNHYITVAAQLLNLKQPRIMIYNSPKSGGAQAPISTHMTRVGRRTLR